MKIELYDYEAAACATKIRWLLAEEDLTAERHRVDLLEFDHKRSEYLMLHPKGLVPAVSIDGELIADADDAMLRLTSALSSPLAGNGQERSVRNWLARIAEAHLPYGAVYYDQVFLPCHRERDPGTLKAALANIAEPETRARMEYLIANGIEAERIEKCLKAVEALFRQANSSLTKDDPWLAGGQFTIADIGLFPYVNSPMMIVSALWADNGLTKLENWLARMRARPAYTKAVVNSPYEPRLWNAFLKAPGGGGFRAARLIGDQNQNPLPSPTEASMS